MTPLRGTSNLLPMRLASTLVILWPAMSWAAGPDFEKEVAPIFESRCLSCHDESHAKGDVRLDTRAHLLESIVVGRPEESVLIEQISGPEPEMPKKAAPLAAAEVETLRRWIAAGALWPEGRVLRDDPPRNLEWWSLKPLAAVEPPEDGHPVDAFLNAAMAAKGVKPVAPADAATLLRRMTYDLTGLPPTPEELGAFERECGMRNAEVGMPRDGDGGTHSAFRIPPSALARLADRLLASPAFGEKWARHWLDVARYGETHGYDKDKPRLNAWPYRDYVIRAFNDDKPYDRFVQEQIAGDALFPGEPDGVLGLGFLAAGPWDFIGHTEVGEGKLDGRIAKHLDRDEMVAAVFNVFASTTVQCAQCHHHKFDPVKMQDYYRLHAVFAAVDRAERVYRGLPPEQERERSRLVTRINQLSAEKDKLEAGINRAIAAQASGLDRRIAELKQQHGAPLKPQYGWHSAISKSPDAAKWVQVDLGAPRAVEEVRLIPAFDTFNQIGAGFGFPPRYKVEAANDAEFKAGVRVLREATREDQPNPRMREVKVDVGGEPVRYLRVTATRLAPRKNDFIFALGELEAIGGEEQANLARGAAVTAHDSIEAAPRWGRANLTDGIYHRATGHAAAQDELRQLEDERAAIEAALRPPETVARLKAIAAELAPLTPQLAAMPKGEVVYAAATDFPAQSRFLATAGKPRPIHLLHRGDLKAPGDAMRPGLPPLWPGTRETFTLPEDAAESAARAALASALTSRDNPLLWRSIVNRLWQWTFGQPLVGTPNDFGRMGLQPTHPELLDYLAARLRDDPRHSMKALIRLLVTSEAYRRASTHDAANAKLDANNTLLWRANRRRLGAEEFRDTVLAVSGVLRLDQRGGPSFRDFVIEKPQHSPHYQYHLHDPADPASHRRSIYRFIVRSQPQPLLTTLDCADPSLSVAARDESTTALQALAQWNNRLIETMSRHFATRLEREAGSPEAKVRLACRLALGREPNAAEQAALLTHLHAHGPANLARVVFNLNALVYVD